jgi:hypothetical protein
MPTFVQTCLTGHVVRVENVLETKQLAACSDCTV